MDSLIIWTWHRVLPEAAPGAVSQSEFAAQLAFLRQRQYSFIDTGELREILSRGFPRGRRLAMLTFDDGWADNLLWATPVLREYNARAVMAVNTVLVNPGREYPLEPKNFKVISSKQALELAAYGRAYDSFLTWDELAELRDSGVWDLQSHGNSHFGCYRKVFPVRGFYPEKQHWTMEYALGCPPFPGAPRAEFSSILASPRTRPKNEFLELLRRATGDSERFNICRDFAEPLEMLESEEEFHARLRGDLSTCRDLLHDKLGIDSRAMFWPWGHYSPAGREAAKACGYDLMLTMDKGVVRSGTPVDILPRIAAPETAKDFRRKYRVFNNPLLKAFRDFFNRRHGEK